MRSFRIERMLRWSSPPPPPRLVAVDVAIVGRRMAPECVARDWPSSLGDDESMRNGLLENKKASSISATGFDSNAIKARGNDWLLNRLAFVADLRHFKITISDFT